MKQNLATLLAASLLFAGCASHSPRVGITVGQLQQIERSANLSGKETCISISIEEEGKITALPPVSVKFGEPAKSSVAGVFAFPNEFELARTSHAGGDPRFPLIPGSLKSFENRVIGLKYEATPRLRGPYIELVGNLTRTRLAEFGRAGGEAFSPILDSIHGVVILENQASVPHFTTDEYRIYAVGLPGNKQTVEFGDLKIHIRCEVTR